MTDAQHLGDAIARALDGGPERHRAKAAEQGKLPVRERVERLLDRGSLAEEALLANWEEDGLGADGVVTGMGTLGGRPVALMANDPTVKAGSWGPKTVEKILRIQEQALRHRAPMVYLVDSAGARITEQVQMFPGRRGAGRIFFNQVRMSGVVPQVCVLFGPSAAGGAYIPAFCDLVIMRDGNASMYLGSPRMAEMVIGEKVTLEEMGGARMHTGVSGCGHLLAQDRRGGDRPRAALPVVPSRRLGGRAAAGAARARRPPTPRSPTSSPPTRTSRGTCATCSRRCVDAESFFEVHARWAKELIVGFARLEGRAIGIVANQPKFKGGVLFSDSADKAARFIWTCNAFNVPLLFLADVPGFMIGTAVERGGHHPPRRQDDQRRVRGDRAEALGDRAQGLRRGLYAMAGPAFDPDCCLALPTRVDRGDGPAGRDQRRLLQPAPGDRGRGRARAPNRGAAPRVRRGHRHPAPRLRARRRRGDRARATCAPSSPAASRSTPGARASGRRSETR